MKEKKTTLTRKLNLPKGIKASVESGIISVLGPKGELKRKLPTTFVSVEVSHDIISLQASNQKKYKRMLHTTTAHLRNMIRGVSEGYTYKLKICSGHFPMNVTKDGSKIVIKNFFGERIPRVSKILDGVQVDIKQNIIEVFGASKDFVGQTAANLEQATRVKNRDRRRFQDGIFSPSKGDAL